MIRALDEPSIGVVGMKLLYPQDTLDQNSRPAGKIQHVGLGANIRGDIIHVLMGWSPDNPKVNVVRDTYAVTGAALMTRRNLWNKTGGLFEGYGLGTFEDVDFCLSVRELGYNVIVETKAVGEHYTGATQVANNMNFPLLQNKLIFLQRWGQKLVWSDWLLW